MSLLNQPILWFYDSLILCSYAFTGKVQPRKCRLNCNAIPSACTSQRLLLVSRGEFCKRRDVSESPALLQTLWIFKSVCKCFEVVKWILEHGRDSLFWANWLVFSGDLSTENLLQRIQLSQSYICQWLNIVSDKTFTCT